MTQGVGCHYFGEGFLPVPLCRKQLSKNAYHCLWFCRIFPFLSCAMPILSRRTASHCQWGRNQVYPVATASSAVRAPLWCYALHPPPVAVLLADGYFLSDCVCPIVKVFLYLFSLISMRYVILNDLYVHIHKQNIPLYTSSPNAPLLRHKS